MKKNTKFGICLASVFIIGVLLGMYVIPNQQASANNNGPFVIIPGVGADDLSVAQVCGTQHSATACCSWANEKVAECVDNGANNCRIMDLNTGTCEIKTAVYPISYTSTPSISIYGDVTKLFDGDITSSAISLEEDWIVGYQEVSMVFDSSVKTLVAFGQCVGLPVKDGDGNFLGYIGCYPDSQTGNTLDLSQATSNIIIVYNTAEVQPVFEIYGQ